MCNPNIEQMACEIAAATINKSTLNTHHELTEMYITTYKYALVEISKYFQDEANCKSQEASEKTRKEIDSRKEEMGLNC